VHFNLSRPVGGDDKIFMARRSEFNRIVHDITKGFGGSISAEHGIGLLKREELPQYKAPLELALMRKLKQALDPAGIMNPGKIFAGD
jgi:FAD/FMN-containing dehydrogenase